ncbi:MAG: hypothetical protein KME43_24550 [Myxacorys chilensis ATA2-1-KO14]|nr:hypothetical protein [Myxacorys chilensis ATA2-1-KO14]
MRKNPTLWDAAEDQICYLQAQFSPHQATSRVDQFQSVLLRIVVLGLGHARLDPKAKLTQAEKEVAIAFLKTLPAHDIVRVLEALHLGFEQLGTSQASRNNYAPRILDWHEWSKSQSWYPSPIRSVTDLRCPSIVTGRGAAASQKLTDRTGRYSRYRLQPEQQSLTLQADLAALDAFLTDFYHVDRLINLKPIKRSSMNLYRRELELMLGFRSQHDAHPIAVSALQLTHLVPLVEEEQLEDMTSKQIRQLWKHLQQSFSDWWVRYDRFLLAVCESTSPRTRVNKLCALIALAKYVYRHQVDLDRDYASIPIIKLFYSYLDAEVQRANGWTAKRQTVVNFEHKWIERREGQTALAAIWEQVVLPLQKETRLRDQWGQLRRGRAIAKSQKSLMIWHRLSSYPAARQSVLRTLKIATYCPITRPEDVPPDGWYLPKVPLEWRELDRDRRPLDNCLYRTYTHQGKEYPKGVYVLEVCADKTAQVYGVQQYVIADQQFDDGTCLYDVYQSYLCGQWLPEGDKNDWLYDWWVQEWRGQRGRWVTKGRMEFEPDPQLQPLNSPEHTGFQSAWSYLFVNPLTGELPSEVGFGKAFENPAYRLTGKRITPHILRAVWATWGGEMGLNEQQMMALAYAMGHSIQTLRRVYERVTPEEKRRSIDQVIDEVVLGQGAADSRAAAIPLEQAMVAFRRLSPQDQLLLKNWLDSLDSFTD